MRSGIEFRYGDDALMNAVGLDPAENELEGYLVEAEAEAYRIAQMAIDDEEGQEIIYKRKLDPVLEKFASKVAAAAERAAAADAEMNGVPDKMAFEGSVLLAYAKVDAEVAPEWLITAETKARLSAETQFPEDNVGYNSFYPDELQRQIDLYRPN